MTTTTHQPPVGVPVTFYDVAPFAEPEGGTSYAVRRITYGGSDGVVLSRQLLRVFRSRSDAEAFKRRCCGRVA